MKFLFTDLSENAIKPHIWGQVALDRMENNSKNLEKLKNKIVSSTRQYKDNIVTNKVIEYDAYERDIAVLRVFFETPTVLEFTTEL